MKHYVVGRGRATARPRAAKGFDVNMRVTTVCRVICPSCFQSIELVIDGTVPHQRYVEDCEVCCEPMIVEIDATGAEPIVEVNREND
jgi:hypothetical protein